MTKQKKEDNELYNPLYNKFNPKELWNLDITIAKFILPRLKAFKKCAAGYPGDLTEKKWQKMLDKMIFTFEYHADKFARLSTMTKKDFKTIREGFDLFQEYFPALWI